MIASIPLGAGWWRGPAPPSDSTSSELGPWVELADGSAAYHLPPGFIRQALKQPCDSLLPPAHRSAEQESPAIALTRALQACARPVPTPNWMAILNLTPDSFSDGGRLLDRDAWILAGEEAAEQGASWLDLGAESTRQGAQAVADPVQLDRLLPAIDALLPLGIPLSIDTRSALVADACLAAGAQMINDVSGLSDPAMAETCARHEAWLTLMHMRGTPETMQSHCDYRLLLGEVADEMALAAAQALSAGVPADRLLLDPGIGFAKDAQQSRELLAHVGAFRALGHDLLVGPSRKSFQADLIPERKAAERDCGTAGAASSCVLQGVATVRLHSGRHWDAVRVAAGIASGRWLSPLPPEVHAALD